MPGSLTLWTLQRALVTATSLYLWLYKLVDPISTCTRHHVLPIHKVIVWASGEAMAAILEGSNAQTLQPW